MDSVQHFATGIILGQVRGSQYQGKNMNPSQVKQVVGKVGWKIEDKTEGFIEDDSER